METRNTNNTNANANNVNIEEVLRSGDFRNAVVKIASIFGLNVHSDIFDDIMQVCSIACIDAARLYDPQLCGGNFLGYAYKRMFEYAKNEVSNQRDIVHIPYNKRNGSKGYEKVTHEYYDLFRPNDGHEHGEYSADDEFVADTYSDELPANSCNAGLSMDIAAALARLNNNERVVFELMTGLREFKNGGRSSITNVAKETGLDERVVKNAYKKALASMREYLA